MPYELQNRLVVGVASSALFDLTESDKIFKDLGEEKYREFQSENIDEHLNKGTAFSFVKRLLSLNDLRENSIENPLVEVILLSRNDPNTGMRVMRSIEYHKLQISRAIFTQGQSPYKYIPELSISLFLSGNLADVLEAIKLGHPAGHVLDSTIVDDENDDLRIAFDFDGVLADDESECVMQKNKKLGEFHEHETKNVMQTHNPGPLKEFLVKIADMQKIEEQKKSKEINYNNRLRVSIVTARNAPSHERALNTLKDWGVMANDAFFLGGIDKGSILSVLRPHIFFDDQSSHLDSTKKFAPSVHIPFGITNNK